MKFIKNLIEALQKVDLYSLPDDRLDPIFHACKKIEEAVDGKVPSQEH